jgi:hypothetical protein
MKLIYKALALSLPFLLLATSVFADELTDFYNQVWLIGIVAGFIIAGVLIEKKIKGAIGTVVLIILTLLTVILYSAIPAEFGDIIFVWFIVPLSLGILAVYSFLS